MANTISVQPSQVNTSSPVHDPRQVRRVLFSSYLGSTIEFYDFLVYGTAASLVFGQLFFSDLSPVVGTLAAFGTLAAGYVARPVGGVIFGHFGDQLGRKKMLIITMMMMGIASTLIGLLPTQAHVGVLAPILLVTLRVIQGVAIGGEWGGATLMALEHSKGSSRGFAVGIVNAGAPSGAVLAAVIMGVFALLPDEQFIAWGWRIPFLISALLVAVAMWIRLGVTESPIFQESQNKVTEKKTDGPPVLQVLRHPKPVLLTMLAGVTPLGIQSLMATFAVTFATLGGVDRSTVLFAAAVGAVVNAIAIPVFGALSDRVGRRPILLLGCTLTAVLALPVFNFIGSGEVWKVYLGFLIAYGLLVGILMSTLSSFISEQFATGSRYTGASLGYQLGATLGGGFAPLIAMQLLDMGGGSNPAPVAGFVAVLAVISALAVLATRESFKKEL